MGLLHVGVDDLLELFEGLAHHMDVMNVQEDQLRVLIGVIPFIPPTCRLESRGQGSGRSRDRGSKVR